MNLTLVWSNQNAKIWEAKLIAASFAAAVEADSVSQTKFWEVCCRLHLYTCVVTTVEDSTDRKDIQVIINCHWSNNSGNQRFVCIIITLISFVYSTLLVQYKLNHLKLLKQKIVSKLSGVNDK